MDDDRISFDKLLSKTCQNVSKGSGADGGGSSERMVESDLTAACCRFCIDNKIIERASKLGIA